MGHSVVASRSTAKRARNKGNTCSNCRQRPAAKGGRCTACYNYHLRTGNERPAELCLKPRREKQPKWCKVCGRLDVQSRGRCSACRQYYNTYGKERPRHLRKTDNEEYCRNCKVPIASLGRRPSGRRRCRKGLCEPCYSYKKRTGTQRPRHLWGTGNLGWCECGYPATTQYDGFNLCSRCATEAVR